MAQPDQLLYEREGAMPEMDQMLEWYEVFTYEVKYGFVKLGEVRVELIGDTLYNDTDAWNFKGIIRSGKGVPFVGEEENHYSSIFENHDSFPRELVYWKDDLDENKMDEERFEYDRDNGEVVYFLEGEPCDTLELEDPATSGPLYFYFSRLFAGGDTTTTVNMYLDDERGTIETDNTNERETRSYDAFDEEVEAFYSEGDADVNGPFGFKGRFKAWFATDDLRTPLEAHVKVWLGNVKIRLIDYERKSR